MNLKINSILFFLFLQLTVFGQSSYCPLYTAVHDYDLGQVKQLIAQGENIDRWYKGPEVYISPLMEAARIARYDMVEILVENGANMYLLLANKTVFDHAKDKEIKDLLEFYEDIIQRATRFIKNDQAEKVIHLVDFHPFLLKQFDEKGVSLFLHAIRKQDLVLLDYFKSKGVDLNLPQKDYYKSTPLIEAAKSGYFASAKWLVENGAIVSETGLNKIDALQWAIMEENDSIAWYLLDNGADVNHVMTHGASCIAYAAYKGKYELAERIISLGIDLRGEKGFAALLSAANGGHYKLFKRLENAGASQSGNIHGQNLLVAACKGGSIPLTEYILDTLGIDPDLAEGSSKSTPLEAAVSYGHYEIVKMLIKRGADVNKPGHANYAPLSRSSHHIEIMELLIRKGADVNPKGQIQTPVTVAVSFGHLEAVKLLVRKGAIVDDATIRNANKPEIKAFLRSHKK